MRVIAVEGASGDELDYADLIDGSPTTRPRVDLRDDDLYALRFTGGTSGLPKGVVMDHRCMTNVINNVLLNWEIGFDEVVCHFHPLSHAAGKIMYTWWMRGARQVILPAFKFEPRVLLETIERERVTSLFMIPTAINVLLDSGLVDQFDTSSLRRIIYGGAPMPARRITEALQAFGPVLTQIYGCSEAPNLLTSLSREDHVFDGAPPERLRSAGKRGYNVEVKVVDEHGADCASGVVGEIVSRGPHTMRAYWKDPELTARRMIDGWVYTGDLGRWDDEGYLYIVDRKDDVIITGGFNVWPAEVENALCAHPAVAEAAVFGADRRQVGRSRDRPSSSSSRRQRDGDDPGASSATAAAEAQAAEAHPPARRALAQERGRQSAAPQGAGAALGSVSLGRDDAGDPTPSSPLRRRRLPRPSAPAWSRP